MADTVDISYGILKEEVVISDDDEGKDDEDELPFPNPAAGGYNESLINFEEEEDEIDAVPDHDPLSLEPEEDDDDIVVLSDHAGSHCPASVSNTAGLLPPRNDYDEDDDDEILPVEVQKVYSPPKENFYQIPESSVEQGKNRVKDSATPHLVFKEVEKPLMITSITTLLEYTVGPSFSETLASFPSLDVFRCYYCRLNYFVADDLMRHRLSIMPGSGPGTHPTKTYDPEIEKPFACGICGKPWNTPRKALACAKFGHDPQAIFWDMFKHCCPICSDECLRFHSLAAVARHWTLEHPDKVLPSFLLKDFDNDVLPTIKLHRYHFEKAKGPFTIKDGCKDRPLVIEHYPPNYCRKRSIDTVTEGGSKKPRNEVYATPLSQNQIKKLKPYRCVNCLVMVRPPVSLQAHTCLRRNDGKIVFPCPRCTSSFTDKRLLKLHLMNYCACFSSPDSQTYEDRNPYLCMVCKNRFGTFQDLKFHRTVAHKDRPFDPDKELPFTCRVCGRPAMIEKEVKLCEVFGHDPISILKAMFKYHCGPCLPISMPKSGFHSLTALRKHWEKEHAGLAVPQELQGVSEENVPLPTVTLTLEQLLNYAENRQNPEGSQSEYQQSEEDLVVGAVEAPNPVVEHKEDNDDDIEIVYQGQAETVPAKTKCNLCGLSFKNLKKHMKVHKLCKTSSEPNNACLTCGIVYESQDGLMAHWKANPYCKTVHMQKRVLRQGGVVMNVRLDCNIGIVTSEEDLMKVVSSSAPSIPVQNISKPIENDGVTLSSKQLDDALALLGDDIFGESAPTPAAETLTFHYGGNTENSTNSLPLKPATEQFSTTESKLETVPNIESVQPHEIKFEGMDIGEIKFVSELSSISNGMNDFGSQKPSPTKKVKRRKKRPAGTVLGAGSRPVICTLCNTGFPNKSAWIEHMEFHADKFPFKCDHCDRRFDAKYKKKSHETIHDPNRFKGEPKFQCDLCGKKYHLEASLSTHRAIKHFGRRFRNNVGPLFQPRPKWTRSPRIKQFPCYRCDRRFAYKSFLQQHIWRYHIGKVEAPTSRKNKAEPVPQEHACEVCAKVFSFKHMLQNHMSIHTGEKAHECVECGTKFRLKSMLTCHTKKYLGSCKDGAHRSSLKAKSKSNPAQDSKKEDAVLVEHVDKAKEFKCIVCGLYFQWSSDLRKHRIIKHGNFPSDPEKVKAFGCGVCGKPYLRRSQAIVCAVLEHDPSTLLQEMFKFKCEECVNSFGFQRLSEFKNHWMQAHPDKECPEESTDDANVEEDANKALPTVTVDEEKAKDIMEKGLRGKFDFELVKEFDLLADPRSINEEPDLPPPVRIRPTPPIRIKTHKSKDLQQEETPFLSIQEPVEDSNPDLEISIDTVMSLIESHGPVVKTEVEIEDIKPFVQFIPENVGVPHDTPKSLATSLFDIESNIPRDNNIDINAGIPPEFQIRRTSARVSKLKSAKESISNPEPKPVQNSKTSGKKPSLNVKENDVKPVEVKSAPKAAPQKSKNVKVKAKLTKKGKNGKSKGPKKLKAIPVQSKLTKGEKVRTFSDSNSNSSEGQEEALPIISIKSAELALSSLMVSTPSLETETSVKNVEESKTVIETSPQPSSKGRGPAILKLLRRSSQESDTSDQGNKTPTERESKEKLDLSSPPISPEVSPLSLLPCSINVHDSSAVQNVLGCKNLSIPVKRVSVTQSNGDGGDDGHSKTQSKKSGVSALVLQLRAKSRRANLGKAPAADDSNTK